LERFHRLWGAAAGLRPYDRAVKREWMQLQNELEHHARRDGYSPGIPAPR